MKILQPPGWPRPRGYSNGVAAHGTVVAIAGQIGWNAGRFETDDLVGQVRQSLTNIVAILAEAGARPEHIVRMNWYLADKDVYNSRLDEIGAELSKLPPDRAPTTIGCRRLTTCSRNPP